MKNQNRFLLALLTGLLMGSSLVLPMGRLEAAPAPSAREAKTVQVSINKADGAELETIKGIGPMLAQRIVDYRQANGRFENLEDLVNVPGIGQAKFEKIRSQITL